MDQAPAPRPVRKALLALAATAGTTVTTLVLTAAPVLAADRIALNHNENAAAELG